MNRKHFWLLPLLAVLAFASCEKDVLSEDVPPTDPFDPNWGVGDSVPIVSRYYFTGKVDSFVYTLQDSSSDYVNVLDSATGWDCDTSNAMFSQSSILRDTTGSGPSLEIEFLQCQPENASLAERLAVFQPMTYPYGDASLNRLTEGVVVKWTAPDGTVYTSRRGTGSNQNFRFNILSVDTVSSAANTATLELLGQMDLVLYNSTIGIRVEAGQFRMKFGIK